MKKTKNWFIVLIMFILSLVMVFPFVFMFFTSVKSMAEIQASVPTFFPRQWNFGNYTEAMSRGKWGLYFWNSFYVTVITIAVSLVINSLAGYSFSRLNFKGRDTLFIISLIGLMIPPQVTMIPLFIILKNMPLVGGNNLFGQGGTGLVNTYAGMVFPYIAGSFGVFMFRQFFLNFPKSLDDAASIDGLNKFKTFVYIYIPLSKPVFATLAALKATQTWTEYTWPLIITNTDGMKTVQLALTVFRSEFEVQWNLLMAATTLITLPLVLVFLFAQKYFVEGITTTGIKG